MQLTPFQTPELTPYLRRVRGAYSLSVRFRARLGVFLPLITTNCAILGVAILVIQKDFNLLQSVVFAIATSLGFALALIIFSGVREQLSLTKVPKAMQGIPIALITAGIIAMAFMGFSGIDQVFK